MLRRKYAKTVQVGAAGRTTNTARADRAANAGGGTGRGVQLDTAQRARLLQLFERHNASRHNVDVVAEGMKQPAAGGGGDATGAAATAEPVELSVGQVLKQLKAMGLRFGQLTERQVCVCLLGGGGRGWGLGKEGRGRGRMVLHAGWGGGRGLSATQSTRHVSVIREDHDGRLAQPSAIGVSIATSSPCAASSLHHHAPHPPLPQPARPPAPPPPPP